MHVMEERGLVREVQWAFPGMQYLAEVQLRMIKGQ